MKRLIDLILPLLTLIIAGACHEIPQYADNPRGNFDALWRTIDEHYCFFREKNIDWNDIYARYSPMVSDKMTQEELFIVCAQMLDELRDGHVNLSSSFNTSYYRNGGATTRRTSTHASSKSTTSTSTTGRPAP